MTLREIARIALPSHGQDGEFDHAAVDEHDDLLFVAHPSNDAVDVVDLARRSHVGSLSNLRGVAGVWVASGSRLLVTSNRGEDTASVFHLSGRSLPEERHRFPTGARPNGLAFDPERQILLVAGVGDPSRPAPPTLTFFDVRRGRVLGQSVAPGRTRWSLYHPGTDRFYANIADPPAIVAVRPDQLPGIVREFPMPARGPHGMEQGLDGTLYCACDQGALVSLEPRTGATHPIGELSGPPDVLWLDRGRGRLYCAVGDPGVVDSFVLDPGPRVAERFRTAPGAHTLTVDPRRHEVHVLLPHSHEDLVLEEAGG